MVQPFAPQQARAGAGGQDEKDHRADRRGLVEQDHRRRAQSAQRRRGEEDGDHRHAGVGAEEQEERPGGDLRGLVDMVVVRMRVAVQVVAGGAAQAPDAVDEAKADEQKARYGLHALAEGLEHLQAEEEPEQTEQHRGRHMAEAAEGGDARRPSRRPAAGAGDGRERYPMIGSGGVEGSEGDGGDSKGGEQGVLDHWIPLRPVILPEVRPPPNRPREGGRSG